MQIHKEMHMMMMMMMMMMNKIEKIKNRPTIR
jgi:hypothetical protein